MLFQNAAADIFPQKNEAGIEECPQQSRQALEQPAERFEKSSHAVDGEHPERSSSHKLQFASAEGIEGSEQYFQAPSGKSAQEKIFSHCGLLLFCAWGTAPYTVTKFSEIVCRMLGILFKLGEIFLKKRLTGQAKEITIVM